MSMTHGLQLGVLADDFEEWMNPNYPHNHGPIDNPTNEDPPSQEVGTGLARGAQPDNSLGTGRLE